jgi:hypothetical protein
MGRATGIRRRAALSAIVALAAALCPVSAAASPARAASHALAPLANVAQKLTAYDGYVVFSEYEPSARDWRLMAWHAGRITALDAPPRDMPFDADAGPGANGAPKLVYSRCSHDPPVSQQELAGNQYLREPDWTRARGCRIYELALPGGSPKLVKGIHAQGASDSTPTIWKGEIAFARVSAGSHVAKIYLWRGSHHLLVRLGGGRPPCLLSGSPCERSKGAPPSAWVGGMSLDGSVLSFEWSTSTATFGEAPFPELRADPLRNARQSAPSQVIEERFASGTCGYGEGISPNSAAKNVLYTTISGDCGASGGGPEEVGSSFQSYSTQTRMWRTTRGGPGLVAALAEDHSTTYWISDVPKSQSPVRAQTECEPGYIACFEPVFEYAQDCAPAHGTCTLMKTDGLSFGVPEVRHPGSLESRG